MVARQCIRAFLRECKKAKTLAPGGSQACQGLNIEIVFVESKPPNGFICNPNIAQQIFEISKIMCNHAQSCEGMHLTVTNEGCHKVVISDFECIDPNACNNVVFDVSGDTEIQRCHCGTSCNNAKALSQCFTGLSNYLCGQSGSCSQQIKSITNPSYGFDFVCSATESCMNSQFRIE